jgi:hypothetical protein
VAWGTGTEEAARRSTPSNKAMELTGRGRWRAAAVTAGRRAEVVDTAAAGDRESGGTRAAGSSSPGRWADTRVMEQGDEEIIRELSVEHHALPKRRLLCGR